MGYAFVSYSPQDLDYADRLVSHLEGVGIETWIDRGPRYQHTIEEAINGCDAVIVIMSPAAKESTWVEKELGWAEREAKPIFSLLLDGQLPDRLAASFFEDVSSGALPSERFVNALFDDKAIPTRPSDKDDRSLTRTAPPARQRHPGAVPILKPPTPDPLDADLGPGRIAFSCPDRVRNGLHATAQIRIVRNEELDHLLTSTMDPSIAPVIESMETSYSMEVSLVSTTGGLVVTTLSRPVQIVGTYRQAAWDFGLLARKAGTDVLALTVSAMITSDPGLVGSAQSLPVMRRSVRVTINPVHSSREFVVSHWKWLVPSAALTTTASFTWDKILQVLGID